MATNEEVLLPKALVLPSIPVTKQNTTAKTGDIGMSGANLVFFNGTAWKYVAGT